MKVVQQKFVKFISMFAAMMALFVVAGCSKLTSENYEKLEMGMEMSEIEGVIGAADSCEEAMGAQACVWGDTQKNIKVKFVADKAVYFSKEGLK